MSSATIRRLTAQDIPAHVEHSLRLMALSGVPPTPIFHVTSRRKLPTAESMAKRHGDWALKETSLAWIDLGVFAHNLAARRLYERLGFRETGRSRDAFRIDDERIDDIQMVLDLNERRWR